MIKLNLSPLFFTVAFLTACGGGGSGGTADSSEDNSENSIEASAGGSYPDGCTPSDWESGSYQCNPADISTKNATILPGPFSNSDRELIPEIAVADLNKDGLLDVLVSVTDYAAVATFKVLINEGNRSFTDQTDTLFPSSQNQSQAQLPFWISKFYTLDMNGDGRVDIVANTSNPGIGVVDRIFIQQENGTFSEEPLATFPGREYEDFSSSTGVSVRQGNSFYPIDADNDGDFDLLVADFHEETLFWRLLINNSTNGVLSFVSSDIPLPSFNGTDQIAFIDDPVVVDVNHDGFMDFVYAGPKWKGGFVNETNTIKILLNNGTYGFSDGTASVIDGEVPALIHGGSLISGDFNGDADDDILIAGGGYDAFPFNGERNVLLLSQSNGLYSDAKTDDPLFATPRFTHSLAAGDLNNDGSLDIVFSDVANGSSWQLGKVLINDGAGNFTEVINPFPNAQLYGTSGGEFGLEGSLNAWTSTKIADMDNDGNNDIILGYSSHETNSIIYWNDGSGTGVFK
ncbi:hypothetical protein GCM10009133_21500 [Cocleimonas flava]|uniref:VCBS repeat protein n=1 Tax=Cocleimonas flava TaxID=634765 RepID=A0A4R1EN85_9GAMM|nr:VCBS repeat-containing protein [Cocleimonas flava]TCJ82686.1 VCBS repeat protein [Cocleimonas flava]